MEDRVLNYIKEFGSITTIEAIKDLGCTRLSEYIRRLRKGILILDKWEYGTNRWNEKTKWKRYYIGDEENGN